VLLRYLAALALTLAVEVPLYVAALVWTWRIPMRRAVLLGVAVNLATHPALWWGLHFLRGVPALLGAELAVCVVEWLLLYWRLRRDPALLAVVAFGANAASLAAGLLLIR